MVYKMKAIGLLLFIGLSVSSKHACAQNEFWYDTRQLAIDFKDIETNSANQTLSKFISLHPSDTAEFTLYDLEIKPFCSGLCCGPLGSSQYTDIELNRNSERKSFWIGCSGFSVMFGIGFYVFLMNYEDSILF